MDEPSAHVLLHAGAVYPHQGEIYLVKRLELADDVALVEAVDPGYVTSARELTELTITAEHRRADWGGAAVQFGEVEVLRQVVAFTRRKPETGQPIGEEALDLPSRVLRTRAVWLTIAPGQSEALAAAGVDLAGAVHAIRTRRDRVAAASRRVRSVGCRRGLDRRARAEPQARRFRLRRPRWRRGLRRTGLHCGVTVAAINVTRNRRLRVRHRLPVLYSVPEMRQWQRATVQVWRDCPARSHVGGCARPRKGGDPRRGEGGGRRTARLRGDRAGSVTQEILRAAGQSLPVGHAMRDWISSW